MTAMIRQFREAGPSDIVPGREVLYLDGDYGPFIMVVEYPLHYGDPYKAYVGADGCRYGLDGAWVDDE